MPRSSRLIFDPVRRRPAFPEPCGPEGTGRLVALRPWQEDGSWEFSWIGATISVTVVRSWEEDGKPAILWHRHWAGRRRGDLPLTEQYATHHRHVSRREVPRELKEIVCGIETRRPEVRNSTNVEPLYPY